MKLGLSNLLGLSGSRARKFEYGIVELEKKINQSVTARIVAEIYTNSHLVSGELGLDGNDLLWQEAFAGIRNFSADNPPESNEDFYSKNKAKILIAKDGIVSLNWQDIEKNMQISRRDQQSVENFQEALRNKIIDEFHTKIPKISKENISKKLF